MNRKDLPYLWSMKQERLKQEVERTLGHALQTAADYEELSELLMEHGREHLSPTTLKRLWGYLPKEQVTTRRHTLDVLARFVGYRDYGTFCERMEKKGEETLQEVQSGILVTERITADMLKKGQMLTVTWNPNRRIRIRHLENGKFVVVEAENTKLSIGDSFLCHLMIQHEPMYVDQLVHEGERPVAYVAGLRDGVMIALEEGD